MANTEVTFYTHPSNWVNDRFAGRTPYDRIAGIAFENEELWVDTSRISYENGYRKTDTEALTLSLPRDFALPIVGYFHDFYSDPPRLYRVSESLNDLEERGNCHRFGTSVVKRHPQDFLTAYGIAAKVATAGKCERSQKALGDVAVLAFSENPYELEHTFAAHTMVSLGDALPNKYIHAVALEGNLAISPLGPFVDDYNKESPTNVYFHGSLTDIHPDPQAMDDIKRAWHSKA